MKKLVIATRRSRLALWQAEHVKHRLENSEGNVWEGVGDQAETLVKLVRISAKPDMNSSERAHSEQAILGVVRAPGF